MTRAKRADTPSQAPQRPRAKKLPARIRRISPETQRALERFVEASKTFDGAAEDRREVSLLDERYAELRAHAQDAIVALIDESLSKKTPAFSDELAVQLRAYAEGARKPGDDAELDLSVAQRASSELV